MGNPDTEQLKYLNRNGTMNLQFPTNRAVTVAKVFNQKAKDLTLLLDKIFVYEPHKRLSALEILANPFFDELRMIDSLNNGKYVVPQLFDFSDAELSLYSNQKNLLKKIIPEWADSYHHLL